MKVFAMKGSFAMKFTATFASICAMFLIVFTVPAMCADIDIAIDVAPSTLNLQHEGTTVTVHTDIAYPAVAGATVALNGVAIDWWKSDNRGYFVAKFDADAVKALDIVSPLSVKLELTGATKDGETFSGSDTIKAINVIPKK